MSVTHADFEKYPLQIAGIGKSEGTGESKVYIYDKLLSEIKDFVVLNMSYTGTVNIDNVLPYFVFYFFNQEYLTTVTANNGENIKIDKVSQPAIYKQIWAWNTGVDLLRGLFGITDQLINERTELFECEKIHAIVEGLGISINEHYLNKIRML